jgi:subtilisin family serine protease
VFEGKFMSAKPFRNSWSASNRAATLKLFAKLSVIAACAGLGAVSSAATVEFKISPDVKGREYRQLLSSVSAMGALTSASGTGVYSMTLASDAAANAAVQSLREKRSVLWAAKPSTEVSDKPALQPEYHPRIMALELHAGSDPKALASRLSQATGQSIQYKRMAAGNRALVVLPSQTTPALMAAVAVTAEQDSAVVRASRVRVMKHQWIPNDSLWTQQWSLGNGVGGIRAADAWDLTPSGSVQVAVIDTGIRSHPDLDGKRVAGFDMIQEQFISVDGDGRDSDPSDPGDYECPFDNPFGNTSSSWHGTHVAGIVAATTNNQEGLSGVAPNARIQSVRALGRCGGTAEDVADSIRWAAGVPVPGLPSNPNPSKVLNLSLGGSGPCEAVEQSAVDAAVARGAIVVVAAGNDASLASDFSPANCKGVIAVAASNLLGDISSYSNFGSIVSISAPGGDFGNLPGIISTLNGNGTQPGAQSYAVYSGTSMAAPHVAGVVALMLARDPSLTPGQVLNRLQSSVRAFPSGSDCASVPGACGKGLLDAGNAVASVVVNRGVNEIAASRDRVHVVELFNNTTGRYQLSADPVEITRLAASGWSRTGYIFPAFSFTKSFESIALAQPVCRARLLGGDAAVFSANTGECKDYAANAGLRVDGVVFAGALPNPTCPVGSYPIYEMVRQEPTTFNVRTLYDVNEMARLRTLGWRDSRIAFCAPN